MASMPTERMVVIPNAPADVDLQNRILRGVRFVTRAIANDGGIVLPDGLRTDIFEAAPEILARHGMATMDATPQHIGRGLELRTDKRSGEVDVQFADTALGRDYAYLYGVNEKREVYARGWSFGWKDAAVEVWGLARARQELGSDFDEDTIPTEVMKKRSVWVVTRGVLVEISATPKRADLGALTKAYRECGIREAGTLVQAMNLDEALRLVAELKSERELDRERIARLEQDMAALRGEAPSPAALGDGEGILHELEALRDAVRQMRED